jgi:hypothetical protein
VPVAPSFQPDRKRHELRAAIQMLSFCRCFLVGVVCAGIGVCDAHGRVDSSTELVKTWSSLLTAGRLSSSTLVGIDDDGDSQEVNLASKFDIL